MARRLTTVAVLSAVVLLVPAAPVAAYGRPLVEGSDAAGDVRLTDRDGPTVAQRRSIDLRELRISEGKLDEPSRRFTLRLKHLTRSRDFEQRIDVLLRDADPELPDTSGDLIWTLQGGHGTGYVSVSGGNSDADVACYLEKPHLTRRTAVVRLDVPLDCLPPGQLRIRVLASTVPPDGGPEGAFSRDRLRVRGSHDLGGTAGND